MIQPFFLLDFGIRTSLFFRYKQMFKDLSAFENTATEDTEPFTDVSILKNKLNNS